MWEAKAKIYLWLLILVAEIINTNLHLFVNYHFMNNIQVTNLPFITYLNIKTASMKYKNEKKS